MKNKLFKEVLELYREYVKECNQILGGYQIVIEFPNKYGINYVNHKNTQGNEISVLYQGRLTYITDITKGTSSVKKQKPQQVLHAIEEVRKIKEDIGD